MSAPLAVLVHNAMTQTDTTVEITSDNKPNPNQLLLLKWQSSLDFLANLFGLQVCKITAIHRDSIELLLANNQSKDHQKRSALGTGGMDEAVISQGEVLVVENSSEADCWPDHKLPMAYLGMPIRWPDHEFFGTLSIEDPKAHTFSDRHHKLMASFREMVNADLALLIKSDAHKPRTGLDQPKLTPIKAGICLYDGSGLICSWNQSAEDVMMYKAEAVLGQPVSFVFPMFEKVEGPSAYTVVTGNNELKNLYIEKSTMLAMDQAVLQVLSFSDQTDYLNQNTAGVGELHRDEQSGLYNHDTIVGLLNQEAKRAHRYKLPLAIVAVMVNGYPFVEKMHGDGSSDLIVQTLAIILKNETRDVDTIGRLSDDLFIICLPNTAMKAAEIVAGRIGKVAARYSDDATPFTVSSACMDVRASVVDWEMAVMEALNKA